MSRYYKFNDTDILNSVLDLYPEVSVMSSSASGWSGSLGPSASVYLHSDLRSRPTAGVSISPHNALGGGRITDVPHLPKAYPVTASIRFVRALNEEPVTASLITKTEWYEEHFRPILNLYDFYSRKSTNYTTATLDYYSLFFDGSGSYVQYTNPLTNVSSSFTIQARFKALKDANSGNPFVADMVILSKPGSWKFYIEGSTQKFAFSGSATKITSSITASLGEWNAITIRSNGSIASFYSGLTQIGSAPFTASLYLGSDNMVAGVDRVGGNSTKFFHGYLFESRIWSSNISDSVMSASYNTTIQTTSSYPSLKHYARYNDGPYSTAHGGTAGSGSYCYVGGGHGTLTDYGLVNATPTWQPCDDQTFYPAISLSTRSLSEMKLFHVPAAFYGREIAPGTVVMSCDAYSARGIKRVLVDDGLGNLYVSGSMNRPVNSETREGVKWNRVGNVFYSEGLVIITDRTLFDYGSSGLHTNTTDLLGLSFLGHVKVPTQLLLCKAPSGQLNCSNNESYSELETFSNGDTRKRLIVTNGTTYISSIGIYDRDRRLVAVAKLAQPIRKRIKDRLLFKIRVDR